MAIQAEPFERRYPKMFFENPRGIIRLEHPIVQPSFHRAQIFQLRRSRDRE